MEWLIENFGKLLPILLMVLYFWLNARKAKPEAEEGAEEGEPVDQVERARGIQEEIRRRILERQRGEAPRPRTVPPGPVAESLHQAQEATVRSDKAWPAAEVAKKAERGYTQSDYAEVLEQQSRLAEQFEQARLQTSRRQLQVERGRAAAAKAISPIKKLRGPERRSVHPLRRALLADLAGSKGLRRGIVLREVLGEPVALRSGALPPK